MTLSDIPIGSTVFVDTNIFLYFFSAHPRFGPSCKAFFERCKQGQYKFIINEAILNEIIFGLIIEKGADLLKTTSIKRIREQLGRNKGFCQQAYAVVRVSLAYINMLPALTQVEITRALTNQSVDIGENFGLLPTDAIHAATCEVNNIQHIATNDPDFDRVDFLTVYKP